MIVDDEPDILSLLEKALNIEGFYNIIKTDNGACCEGDRVHDINGSVYTAFQAWFQKTSSFSVEEVEGEKEKWMIVVMAILIIVAAALAVVTQSPKWSRKFFEAFLLRFEEVVISGA